MPLPTSGPISFSAIATEVSDSGSHYFGESVFRSLINKPSGPIRFSDFRGASVATFITPVGTTLYSAGMDVNGAVASYVIERVSTAIKVTVTVSGAVGVWNFPEDFGYASFVGACTSGEGVNNAFAGIQTHYSHSAIGFGYVSYDGTNVLISVDFGTYSYDFPPNPTYGTFINNYGLGIGAGDNTQAIGYGRQALAQLLNSNITPSSIIQHGYPGYVSKFFPARRIP